jgi:hypothetical protein
MTPMSFAEQLIADQRCPLCGGAAAVTRAGDSLLEIHCERRDRSFWIREKSLREMARDPTARGRLEAELAKKRREGVAHPSV